MTVNINQVVITGNLTRDPELRSLPSGTSVCNLGIAVNESFKNSASGEWEERANFFDVTVWGAQGENAARYLEKGRPVAIAGRLRWHSWETDSGDKRSKVDIIANTVQFLGTGTGNGGSKGGEDPDYHGPASSSDDDIPF